MKKLFMILPILMILCLSAYSQVKEAETSSEDLEKELRATLEQWGEAWKSRDIDTIIEIEGDAIGYGYRTAAARLVNKERLRAATTMWLGSMEIVEGLPKDDYIVRVVGDVGLVLGTVIEKTKPKGGDLQSIEVRLSLTFIRVDGKWKMALYHRDTQFAK